MHAILSPPPSLPTSPRVSPAAAASSSRALVAVVVTGVLLRVAVLSLEALQQALAARPELVTAVSSTARVREGALLFARTGSPYAGDVFHQPPLVFALFQLLPGAALLVAVDAVLALGFARLARRTLALEEGVVPRDSVNREIWLHRIPVSPLFRRAQLPVTVAMMCVLVLEDWNVGIVVVVSNRTEYA